MIYCPTESSFNLWDALNFACVAYLNTIAFLWFTEQLYSFDVIEFYILFIDTLFYRFSGFLLFFCFILYHHPLRRKS